MLPRDNEGKVRFVPPKEFWPHVNKWGWLEWHSWLTQQGWTDDAVTQYLEVDRYKYGFGLRRNNKEPWSWFYLPIPNQVIMHACRFPNVGFGGAAGGSKSHGSRWDAYRHCWTIPNFSAIIMRRTFGELKRNHMDKVRQEAKRINDFLGQEVMQFVPSEFELRFAHNGSKVIFGHCQNPGDEDKYLSDEYDAFYPDEVATFLQAQVLGVAGRLRSTIEGVEPRMVATTNPAGAHTLWYKDWFVDHNVNLEEYPDYDPKDYYFIQSLLYDNPYLMDKDGTFSKYIKRLGGYSPMRRKQMLEGDWSAITGQYFEDFAHPKRFQRIAFSELRGCRIERWIDWGFSKPGVCYWVAIFPSGHVHTFFEYKFEKTIANVVAVHIRDITKELLRQIGSNNPTRQLRIHKTIADPSMFNLDGHVAESYATVFARAGGVVCTEGDNQRVLGWGRMRSWMAMDPTGRMWWTVDNIACPYAARTIGSLVTSKSDPEDCDTTGEDHAADAHRYGFQAQPMPANNGTSRTPPLTDSVRALLDSIHPKDNTRPAGMVS